MSKNSNVAQATAMPIALIFVLFSGFYANTDLIPVWLNWISWINPLRWSFAACVKVDFVGVNFICPNVTSTTGCIPNGEAMIERLDFTNDSFEKSVGFLLGFYFLMLLLAYTILRMKKVHYMVPKRASA